MTLLEIGLVHNFKDQVVHNFKNNKRRWLYRCDSKTRTAASHREIAEFFLLNYIILNFQYFLQIFNPEKLFASFTDVKLPSWHLMCRILIVGAMLDKGLVEGHDPW